MMIEPFSNIVDFSFYNLEEEQFLGILRRVTTSVVNSYFNQQFTINEIYDHITFLDGDVTNLHVYNLMLSH